MTSIDENKSIRLQRRSYLLKKIPFSLSKGYYNFVYQMIKDKCASINEQPIGTNWLQLETSLLNKEFLDGKTPLILCSYLKETNVRMSMARMLIENGAKINMINPKNGCNALHYACALLCFDLIEYYLNYIDFNLSITDYNGNTALFYLISSLHLIKLNDNDLKEGYKLISLYLKISKRYSYNIFNENKFGLNLLNLCKLLANKQIYYLIKSALNGTLEELKPLRECNYLHEDKQFSKDDILLENIESISITSSKTLPQKTTSRPTSACSNFLDEIINFKKWSKPLIKSSKVVTSNKILDDLNITKLRTHASTPIIKPKTSLERQISEDLKTQINITKMVRVNESSLKKHLLIDVNEIKYKRIEYSKEADEKLVKIYIKRLSSFDDDDENVYCTNQSRTDVLIIKPDESRSSRSPKRSIRNAHSTFSLLKIANNNNNENNEIKVYRSRSALQIANIEEKNRNKLSERDLKDLKTHNVRAKSAQVFKNDSRINEQTPIKSQKKKSIKKIDTKLNVENEINDNLNETFINQQHHSRLLHSRSQSALTENNENNKKSIEIELYKYDKPKRLKKTDPINWKNEFSNYYNKYEIINSKSYRKGYKPIYETPKTPDNAVSLTNNESKTNEKSSEKSSHAESTSTHHGQHHTPSIVNASASRSSGWIHNTHNYHNHISNHK